MKRNQQGITAIGFLIIFLVVVTLFFGVDWMLVDFITECGDISLTECAKNVITLQKPSTESQTQPQEMINASTSVSEEGITATVTLTFPKNGGEVVGTVTGDCKGKIQGTFAGGEGGLIQGKGRGSCNLFIVKIPGSGQFTGNVSLANKIVDVEYTGSALGQTRSGTAILRF